MSDPWQRISQPGAALDLSGLRVDANIPWGFFWTLSGDGKPSLILRYSSESRSATVLPLLKEIEVIDLPVSGSTDRVLIYKLMEPSQKELFYTFCQDVVSSAQTATNEQEALDNAIVRTWRWYHLLRVGSNRLLSEAEQKGLIGELLVLERELLPFVSTSDAVSAWKGPFDAPKDFEIGGVCIEVKARWGAATPFVTISSEFQLDDDGVDELFLCVEEISSAPAFSVGALTITNIAARIRDSIARSNLSSIEPYENALLAAGFDWRDDYSSELWVQGRTQLYRVNGNFPRITTSHVNAGVSRVKYSISLVSCEPFIVHREVLRQSITKGQQDG